MYFILSILHAMGCFESYQSNLLSSINNNSIDIKIWEISFAIVVAVILSLTMIIFVNKNGLSFLLRKYGKSHYFTSIYTLENAFQNNKAEWVIVRDYANGYAYKGRIEYYSADSPSIELLLKKVTVLSVKRNKELSKIPWLFLKFKKDDLVIIEFLNELE